MAKKEEQKAAAAPVPPPTETRALVPNPKDALTVQIANEGASAFLSEIDGPREAPAAIPFVTINHHDGVFMSPAGEPIQTVEGYPVFYFQSRRLYLKPPIPGQPGQPPDCWSPDLIKPASDSRAKQSDMCASCKWNQWGSARDAKSKACSTFTYIFLVNPAFGTPPMWVLVIPPSSIKDVIGSGGRFANNPGYFAKCMAKTGGVYEICFTKFGLEQIGTPGQGVVYCKAKPSLVGVCTAPEQTRALAQIRNNFMKQMTAMRGTPPVTGAEAEDGYGGEDEGYTG